MFLANSTCFAIRLPGVVLAQLLAEDQDRVQRRSQFVRHVRQELGLVLRRERQLGRLLLERAARLFDFVVLPLHLDVLLGQLLGLRRQLLVRLLQFGLPRLQLRRELLRLLQQVFRPHRGFDRVEHDADRLRELFEERQVRRRERMQRREFDDRARLAFEQHRQHDDVGGPRPPRLERMRNSLRVAGPGIGLRHVAEQDALLLERALADEAFAER